MTNRNSPAANAGAFFSLSTIPQLQKAGQSELDEERRKASQFIRMGDILYNPNSRESQQPEAYRKALEAERQHEMDMLNRRLDAKTVVDKRPRSIGHGVILNEETGEYGVPPVYQQQIEDDRAARMNRAQVMRPPPASAVKKMAEWDAVANGAESIMQKIEALPSVASPMRDILTNAIREGVSPDIGNLAEGQLMSPDERGLKAEMKLLMMELRHANFGSALTATEKALFAANDPAAAGIDFQEAVRRTEVIVNLMRSKRDALGSYYKQPQQAGAPMPAPAPMPAAPAPQQGRPEVQRKSYKGEDYISLDGYTWEKANGR